MLFCLLVLAAIALSTWLVSDLAVDAVRKSTGQNLEEITVQLRDKIELDLQSRFSDLKVAAAIASQSLDQGRATDVASLLDALTTNFPSYAWIGLVSPAGVVLASNGGLLQGVNVSHRAWFQAASKRPFFGDPHEAELLAEQLSSNTSAPLRFVDVAVPLKSADGTLKGVLGAHLHLDWVAGLGQSLLAPLQARLKSELIVADQTGAVLIGPEQTTGKRLNVELLNAARSGQSGYLITAMDLPGIGTPQEYLVGYSRLRASSDYPGLDWFVLVQKPLEDAFLEARDLHNTILAVGAAMGLLLILLAYSTARLTTRPLLQMAREAKTLDPNNPDTLIKLRDDYEEVRVLSSVLSSLIQRLAEKTRQMNQLNTTLEQRVVRRTLELQQANRQLEETVRTDALTGLNNRRYLFELGQTAIRKAERSGTPVSAIMFDADFFKRVNDTYGHGVGDKALIHLSELARRAVRDVDILARIGGEEFAILLENTTEDKAAEVAERLRASIADAPLIIERGELPLTVSIGLASFIPKGSDALDVLLVLADKALYAAKAGGRNRVCRYAEIAEDGNTDGVNPDHK